LAESHCFVLSLKAAESWEARGEPLGLGGGELLAFGEEGLLVGWGSRTAKLRLGLDRLCEALGLRVEVLGLGVEVLVGHAHELRGGYAFAELSAAGTLFGWFHEEVFALVEFVGLSVVESDPDWVSALGCGTLELLRRGSGEGCVGTALGNVNPLWSAETGENLTLNIDEFTLLLWVASVEVSWL